ncbi:MAG TPA: hypothetical protein VGD26_07700 [Chitinophagaceae bacterium]
MPSSLTPKAGFYKSDVDLPVDYTLLLKNNFEKLDSRLAALHTLRSWTTQAFWKSTGTQPVFSSSTGTNAYTVSCGKIFFFRHRTNMQYVTNFGTGTYYWDLPNNVTPTNLMEGQIIGKAVIKDGRAAGVPTNVYPRYMVVRADLLTYELMDVDGTVVGPSTPVVLTTDFLIDAQGWFEVVEV